MSATQNNILKIASVHSNICLHIHTIMWPLFRRFSAVYYGRYPWIVTNDKTHLIHQISVFLIVVSMYVYTYNNSNSFVFKAAEAYECGYAVLFVYMNIRFDIMSVQIFRGISERIIL